ncbi:major intrinsic protein channel protein (MIP) [Bifidobacterium bombi DSM 19703]|uniref:Major intrinsic protein channel protein (MIP) n=2 Tax=Bifidobacterium bombi TaxID=471511 RepID=A0A080N2N6_9BIFI|nr:major intrinsic protein channel protein (MIP) [Bifidobacterium bombi DSM 19703]
MNIINTDSDEATTRSYVVHLIAAFGAELVGTFLICAASYIVSSLSSALYGTSMLLILLSTAVAYAAMTLLFGRISGGQFNPAITIAAALTGKTSIIEGICDIIAQIIGAIASGALVTMIIPRSSKATAMIWFSGTVNGFDKASISSTQISHVGISFNIWFAFAVEVLATLVIVAMAMRTMNEPDITPVAHAAGMGFAYAVGVAMTYPITASALNPARATGIAIFLHKENMAADPLKQVWLFWVASILAAAVVSIVIIVFQMLQPHASQDNIQNANDDFQSSETSDVLEAFPQAGMLRTAHLVNAPGENEDGTGIGKGADVNGNSSIDQDKGSTI